MNDNNNLFKRLYNSPIENTHPYSLYSDVRGSKSVVQRMKLLQTLPVHNGCVNSICWSDRGDLILSGSDDQKLCITNANSYKVLTSIQTGHRANIFSARFLPNTSERKIISCSGDGLIMYTDLERPENNSNCFDCHIGTTYKIITIPNDPNSFLSCGEDGTVRWFDLRVKQLCNQEECRDDILISCRRAITALALNPVVSHQLVLGSSDSSIQMYDRRMLGTRNSGWPYSDSIHGLVNSFTVPTFEGRSHRITSLSYSKDGEELLASFSSEYIYLFRLQSNQCDQSALLTNERKKVAPLPVKRLRLRGDWSDTGPNARPERELRGEQTQQQSLRTSLMQRMSYVLTRMLSDSPRRQRSVPNEVSSQGEGESADNSAEVDVGSSAIDIHTSEPLSMDTASSVNELMELQPEVVLTSPFAVPETTVMDINVANVELEVDAVASNSRQADVESDEGESSGTVDPETTEPVEESPVNVVTPKISVEHCGIPEPEEEELSGIKKALKCQRKQLLKKHKVEPTVSLHYSPQGVSSGVISMNNPSTSSAQCDHPSTESSISKSEEMLSSADAGSSQDLSTNEMERFPDPDQELREMKSPICGKSSSPEKMAVSQIMDSDKSEVAETSNSSDNSSISSEAEEKQATPSNYEAFRDECCSSGVKCSSKKSWDDEDMEAKPSNPPSILHKYVGHRNARTMIKEANFWGDNFIVSGSDCGHIFFWDRYTEEVAMVLEADRHVVNCVQPHPFDPVLASSGIDYDVKMWAPLHDEPSFDEKTAKVIMLRNEVMLEETRDTITVPASFMIRMLASLSHLRSGNLNRRNSQQNPQ